MTEKFDYSLPNMYSHDGMWQVMPTFPPGPMEAAKTFPYTSDDVIIATYRKAGTTWMSHILDLVYNNDKTDEIDKTPLTQRVPCLELANPMTKRTELEYLREQTSPRLMVTHLPVRYFEDAMDKTNVKVIVVMRNPKDNLVSYYHFYRMNRGLGFFPHSWDDFFELIKGDKLVGGNWFDYNLGWWAERHRDNVHVMSYEGLKKDPVGGVKAIAEFCGRVLSEDVINSIVEQTSFSKMQNNPMVNHSTSKGMRLDISKFIRKGEVGDWKNYWTQEQSEWFDKEYEARTKGTGLEMDFESK